MKKSFFVFVMLSYLMASVMIVQAQTNVWMRDYFNGADDYIKGKSVFEVADGYVFIGQKDSYNGVLWVHTDFDGIVLDDHSFELSTGNVEKVVRADRDSSGNFYILGKINSDSYFIIKTDSSGSQLWTKRIRSNNTYTQDIVHDIKVTSDGGFILAASGDNPSGSADTAILKFNSSGSLQWQHTDDLFDDEVVSIAESSSDTGYVYVTKRRAKASDDDLRITKISTNGSLLWRKAVGIFSAQPTYIQATQDGFIVVGNWENIEGNSQDYFIIKIDDNGNLQWARRGDLNNYISISYDPDALAYVEVIDEGSTQSFVAIGTLNQWDDLGSRYISRVFAVKYDWSGELIWARKYWESGSAMAEGYEIRHNSDDSLIATGYTHPLRFGANEWYLHGLKVDPGGDINQCNLIEDPGVTDTDVSPSVTNSTGASGNVTFSVQNLTASVGNSSASAVLRCDADGFTPYPFSLLSPSDAQTGVSINADLDWEDSAYATNYSVYFGTSNPPSFVTSVTSSQYDPGMLTNGETYYWYIKSHNTYGEEISETWSFTVETVTNCLITGNVILGASGLSGVKMNGLPASPVTDGSGYYTDNVLLGWSGSVTPTASGYTFTPEYRTYTNVTSNQTNQYYTAVSDSNVFSISGTVLTYYIAPEANVAMNGLPGSPQTDSNGFYIGTVESGWSGTVVPVKPAFVFSPDDRSYTNVQADQTNQDYGAAEGYTYHYISGAVETSGGTPIVNVLLSGLPGDPYTNGAGEYIAAVDDGWSGTAVPAKTGYTFAPISRSYSSVSGDQADEDYTGTETSYTISGTVTYNSSGLSGVLMNGLPGDPSTAVDGTYSSQVGHGWSGIVEPVKTAYMFTPESRQYNNVTTDQSGQDYTAAAAYLISGTVTESGSGLSGIVMNGLPDNPATIASGYYEAYVMEGWSGAVTPTGAGYVFDPKNRFYINVAADYTAQDYTATADAAVIGVSGHVDDGTNPLANVVLNGLPINPSTNAAGYYIDTVDSGWSGTVVPAASGYSFTPSDRAYSNVTADQIDQDYTGTDDPMVIAISGNVTMSDGTMIAGVEMTGLPHTPDTNPSGYYIDTVDYSATFSGWSGTVTPTHADYNFTPENRSYTGVTTDQTDQDYTAEAAFADISGTVTAGGSGLSGVTLNGLPSNPQTIGDGTYTGTVETGWSGVATPSLSGYTFTPSSRSYTNVTADQTGEDYTASGGAATYAVTGTVDDGTSGLADVVMNGLPHTVTTAADGTYYDTVASGWSGVVTPVLSGYTFTPASRSYSNVAADQTSQDYTGTDNSGASYVISGNVNDGTAGLSGAVLNGLPGNPATAPDGDYTGSVDSGWSGVVTPVLSGYTFTPSFRSYSSVSADQTSQDYTATASGTAYTIFGNVNDGTNGLADVVLNGLPGNVSTNAAGDYTAAVTDGWSGTAVPTAAGYDFNPETRAYINVSADQENQDYTATADATVIGISGHVDDGTDPLAGVVLNGLPINPSTNPAGYYIDTVDSGWSGTVIPAAAGYTFAPANTPYSNVTTDQTDQDYTATSDSSILGISGHVTMSDGTMIAGVDIGGLPNTPVTNPSGYYIDTVASGWSGTITPAHASYTFTPTDASFTSISTDQTQDFTAELADVTISGTVTESGSGLADVVMNGLPGSPQTLGDGTYSGTVGISWSGVVTPTLSGYAFTPETRSYSSVDTDQSGEDYTAAPDASVLTVSGTVTESSTGLENVVMNGLPGTVTTAPDGTYSDSVDSGWTGVVTPALSGYDFTPASRSYTNVTTDQTAQDYTATDNGGTTFTVSGNVNDGTDGIADVVLNGLPGSVNTGPAGDYTGTVDSGWSGVVTPAASGWAFTPETRSYSDVTADQTDQDYTGSVSGTTYIIAGNVNDGTSGIGDVVMNGLPGNPATGPAGDYTGTVIDGWSGAVTPTAAGYVFSPENRAYLNVTSDQTDQDYTAAADGTVIGISGHVDDGTDPLAGVVLNGLPINPDTNAAGFYIGTVDSGWSGTVVPAAAGYAFTPTDTAYSNVTTDQTDQDYIAATDATVLGISGHVTEADGTMVAGVSLTGLPHSPTTNPAGYYLDTAPTGWSGTAAPVLSGYSFEPENRTYASIAADQTDQDYTATAGYYNSPSNYQVIPEVLWAPATGGGTWMTEVQITDVTGGSEVSVYFNSVTGDRRGPIALFTGSGPDTSVKAGNLLNTLDQLDSGFSYYGLVGAVEFITQDADHKIHVIARTKNGNYSKTFPGLNHNDDNTAGGTRTMMIQNLANNDTYRTAYGGFNPTDDSITVEYELIDGDGSTIGSTFTKTFTGRQYQAVSVFSEAGVPYPTYSYENVWLKITPASGSGELMSYGATANNITSDPAVHIAAQAQDIDGYNSPSNYQVIPEVLWAPATGGGTWMTEVQITDITGGSEVSVYFNASTGDRRGPITLFTGSGAGVSARAGNLLATLDALDSGFDYYATVGTVEFVTQDDSHNIQVIARTANGNYSKTFQGLNNNDANTASSERTLMVQNLVNDNTYRTAFGAFNPTDSDVTVEFTLMDENGSAIGTSFSKTFTGRQYQAFNPFTESGVAYPSYSYDNAWIKVEVTSGSGQLMVYGATANNVTSDPAVHRAGQH